MISSLSSRWEGLPEIGWVIAQEMENEFPANEVPDGQPGHYRVLVAEAARGIVLIMFFNKGGELHHLHFEHLQLKVALPLPNFERLIVAPELARLVLARLSEGAIGPPSNWRSIDETEESS
jgi:hypothetical protein